MSTGYNSNIWSVVKIVESCIAQVLSSFNPTISASLFFKFDLKDVPESGYLVTVIPQTESHEKASRVHDDSSYDVMIAIQRKVQDEADAIANADQFFGYVETVQKFFRSPDRQGDGIPYRTMEHEALYGHEHIKKYMQLTSILKLTVTRTTT